MRIENNLDKMSELRSIVVLTDRQSVILVLGSSFTIYVGTTEEKFKNVKRPDNLIIQTFIQTESFLCLSL